MSQIEYAKRQDLPRKQLSQWVNKVRQNKIPQSKGTHNWMILNQQKH
ncbi:hypothetical protein [Formosimonas limnophila]